MNYEKHSFVKFLSLFFIGDKLPTVFFMLGLFFVMAVPGIAGAVTPVVIIDTYGETITDTREASFYYSTGLTIAEYPPTGKVSSDNGILTCTVDNMDMFPQGLDWQITRISGDADVALETRNNGMNSDLKMRTMPSSAGDSVFCISCLDQGTVIWSKNCTIHVKKLSDPLPTGNQRNGGNTVNGGWYADVGENIPMSDIFDFTGGWRIKGETHKLVYMDSPDDNFWENVACGEGLNWDMNLRAKGVYLVIVVTSCRNIRWATEYTLYVGKTPRISGNTIRIPEGVKTIPAKCFMNTNAQVVIIPNGCKTIGAQAFDGSSRLTEVEIPASVTKIDSTAFDNCPNLQVFITSSQAAINYAEAHGLYAAAE